VDQASGGNRPGRLALVTLEELRTSLIKTLDAEPIARNRVRIEWELNKLSAQIIAEVVRQRFDLTEKKS